MIPGIASSAIVQFTNVLDFLIVGAGGGGGSAEALVTGYSGTGGGGGGGRLIQLSAWTFPSGYTYNVTVGAGGAGGTTMNGGTGGNTSVVATGSGINYVAYGGGGGAGAANNPRSGNASPSAIGSSGGSFYGALPGSSTYSYVGGIGSLTDYYAGGGGGGAGGSGFGGNGAGPFSGGAAVSGNATIGLSLTYGGGGAGGPLSSVAGADGVNRGFGGQGGGLTSVAGVRNNGGKGGNGVAVFRHLSKFEALKTTGGCTISFLNGYTYYTFTSDGTFIVP